MAAPFPDGDTGHELVWHGGHTIGVAHRTQEGMSHTGHTIGVTHRSHKGM